MNHHYLQAPEIQLDGAGLHIGIIVARFRWHITGATLKLAEEELKRLDVQPDAIHVVTIPGSFELPTAAQAMLAGSDYDALICIGCVMKGGTRHDIIIADTAAQGIQRIALDHGIPIIFGVMCAENEQQAQERIERGVEYAQDAVEMARIIQRLKQGRKELS